MSSDLKPGTIELGPARLELSYSGVVAPHLRGALREITGLWCAPAERRKGHAKALLADVCRVADAERVSLLLMPEPFGEGYGGTVMDADALTQWYARAFGFFTLQFEPRLIMLRLPNEVQPTATFMQKPVAGGVRQALQGGLDGSV